MQNSDSIRKIFMVSKPIAPPWNDSSKNLVKDLALCGQRFSYQVLTPQHFSLEGDHVVSEPLYSGAGDYSPGLMQNLKVLLRLFKRDDSVVTHFFFAPNPKTSLAARLAKSFRRRITVQTVCSTPGNFQNAQKLLFADKIVVLSRHTRDAFLKAGIKPGKLELIPPGIQLPPLPSREKRLTIRQNLQLELDQPLVIYPGDYQFSGAAQTVARAIPLIKQSGAFFIFACRIKQAASREIEQKVRKIIEECGVARRVRLLNEVPNMLELLAACDICVLPAESLFAKMDLPLVLLEAMALGVPLIVANRPPLTELLDTRQTEVGIAVPPQDPAALAHAIDSLLQNPERLESMRQNARLAACEQYGIMAVSKRYEDLYEELLEGGGV